MNKIYSATTILLALFLIAFILIISNFGIELTDEGFYLNWISNPFIYKQTTTFFGFVFHPFYVWFGGNLSLLRMTNALAIFLLAWGCSLMCCREMVIESAADRSLWKKTEPVLISFAIASTVLFIFREGLITPNYNTLSLQSLLITTIGVMLAKKNPVCMSLAGWIIIGMGGTLAFLAKPTTALGLGFISCIYLILAKKMSLRQCILSLCICFGALCFSAYAIAGSMSAFITIVQNGIKSYAMLGAGHTLLNAIRLDRLIFSSKDYQVLIAALCYLLTLFYLLIKIPQTRFQIVLLVVFLILTPIGFYHFNVQILPPLSGIFVALVIFLLIDKNFSFRSVTRQQWSIIFYLFLLPYVFAFGSVSNYWALGSQVAFFWVLIPYLLFIADRQRGAVVIFFMLMIQLVMMTNFYMYIIQRPYRQPPNLLQNQVIVTTGPASQLILSQDFARYIEHLRNILSQAGFERSEPILDLSGHSPGAIYLVGGKAIGTSWATGGYPNSEAHFIFTLNVSSSCEEISSAWVITEPEGRRHLTNGILESFGLDLTDDYEMVGSLAQPDSPYTRAYGGPYPQYIYKPKKRYKVCAQ